VLATDPTLSYLRLTRGSYWPSFPLLSLMDDIVDMGTTTINKNA